VHTSSENDTGTLARAGAPTRNPQGARSLFEGLFEALSDQSDLAAPMVQVDEDSKNVFLIWRCPASGFLDATDTFLIDGNTNKIHRQNVAFKSGCPPGHVLSR